jgi:hypothetical protein
MLAFCRTSYPTLYNHYEVHNHQSRVHQIAGFCKKIFRRLFPDPLGWVRYLHALVSAGDGMGVAYSQSLS